MSRRRMSRRKMRRRSWRRRTKMKRKRRRMMRRGRRGGSGGHVTQPRVNSSSPDSRAGGGECELRRGAESTGVMRRGRQHAAERSAGQQGGRGYLMVPL